MDVARTEEEQIEALKKWWAENGWAIVAGVVLGLGGIFGWRAWQAHQITIAEQASDLYSTMMVDTRINKDDEARTTAEKLLEEYPQTTYASFAALMLASLDVENNELASAQKHLQWVIDNTDQNELKHLAHIRLAHILLATGKPDEALALIDKIKQGKFAASYAEVKGDIYMAQGKPEKARTAYQLALSNNTNKGLDNSFLEMKLDDLGRQNP